MERVDLFGGADASGPSLRAFTPVDAPIEDASAPVEASHTVEAVDVRDLPAARAAKPGRTGRVVAGVVTLGVLVAAGVAAVPLFLSGGDAQVAAPSNVSASATPITGTEPEAVPSSVPVPLEGSSAPAPVVVPEIETVARTIAVTFDPASAELDAAALTVINDLATALAPGEQVVVTSYAGRSASPAWAARISTQRGDAISAALDEAGVSVPVTVIPAGTTPAVLDDAAAPVLEAAGVAHNRVAIIAAVVVAD